MRPDKKMFRVDSVDKKYINLRLFPFFLTTIIDSAIFLVLDKTTLHYGNNTYFAIDEAKIRIVDLTTKSIAVIS